MSNVGQNDNFYLSYSLGTLLWVIPKPSKWEIFKAVQAIKVYNKLTGT